MTKTLKFKITLFILFHEVNSHFLDLFYLALHGFFAGLEIQRQVNVLLDSSFLE